MAKNEELAPAIKLPPEMKKRLIDVQGNIASARRSVEIMKSLGMDVSDLEEKLEWSEKVSKTLLTEFTD